MSDQSHLSDQDLLRAADGELSPGRSAHVADHLKQCWSCRARQRELEEAIGEFIRLRHRSLDPVVPSVEGPRARLRAELAQMAAAPQGWRARWLARDYAGAALSLATLVVLCVALLHIPGRSQRLHAVPVFVPEPNLTPGAVLRVSREQLCQSAGAKNQAVPVSLQRRVFEEYGIPAAEPRAYEVDYLITPALGGAEDIHNLWPQSYSSTVWNARVKDALEDRLHDLVCDGSVDLATAQHDISSDWISAYKKYFHTDRPLEEAR